MTSEKTDVILLFNLTDFLTLTVQKRYRLIAKVAGKQKKHLMQQNDKFSFNFVSGGFVFVYANYNSYLMLSVFIKIDLSISSKL